MSLEDKNNYRNQDCCIWNPKIKNEDKVKYHCYLTTEYKDSTYKECSKIPRKLPIIFHNLEGYDGQLNFRELSKFKDINIQVIPKPSEKYMSIIIINNSIVFLGLLQFCKASLDNLAENLENKGFKHLMSEFPKDKLELLRKKTHIHMNGLILIKNLFIQDYHQRKHFIHQ